MINNNNDIIYPEDPVQVLQRFILDSRLRPGDRLPTHADLTKKLKIGSRRLREGLAVLERQGLLETRGRAGTLVAEPPLNALDDPIRWQLEKIGYTVEHLVEARAAIESTSAAQAARKRTARDLLVFLDIIEQMESLARDGRTDEDADEKFHLAILEAGHNPVMLIFGKLISAQFGRKVRDRLTSSLKRQKASNEEHRNIVTAIEKRDPDAASRLMSDHILCQLKVCTPFAPLSVIASAAKQSGLLDQESQIASSKTPRNDRKKKRGLTH
jgi:DNA-binding FadR family transcriptional regulator